MVWWFVSAVAPVLLFPFYLRVSRRNKNENPPHLQRAVVQYCHYTVNSVKSPDIRQSVRRGGREDSFRFECKWFDWAACHHTDWLYFAFNLLNTRRRQSDGQMETKKSSLFFYVRSFFVANPNLRLQRRTCIVSEAILSPIHSWAEAAPSHSKQCSNSVPKFSSFGHHVLIHAISPTAQYE